MSQYYGIIESITNTFPGNDRQGGWRTCNRTTSSSSVSPCRLHHLWTASIFAVIL